MAGPPDVPALAARFVRFAEDECGAYAPTYARLARAVARSPDLLAVAAAARPGQQHQNLFLAACQYLLGDDLRTMSDEAFLAAARAHADALRELCATRLVQTNEPKRAGFLLPALVVTAATTDRPLTLVEVGTSAGLLLQFDRYSYDYGWAGQAGPADSPVRLAVEARGPIAPPLGTGSIRLADRLGVDVQPVRADDADATRWLRALVWPDHDERRARLDAALRLAAEAPPRLVAGDALEVLPDLVRAVPESSTPVVFHHATLAHFPADAAERFLRLVPELARERGGDLRWLSGEGGGPARRTLELIDFSSTPPARRILAETHGHGEWLRWL